MDKKSHYRVIILGSGAAGLTAAIYAARANLTPLVIEGSQPGGQLTITTDVENYPGFPDGIMGPEMMELFKKQAERFGTRHLFGDVTAVDLRQRPFKLTVSKESYTCDALIIATGASAKLLGIESERSSWATACRRARPATASSSKRRSWWSSAAATRRWRKRPSSPSSPARSPSCTGATSCAPRRSCRSAPRRIRRSPSSGTPRSKKSTATRKPAASPACS